jgi:CheY-like chemotaxis protein/tRNA A-37 threonylcarbamoyl transferase component Bud32
MARILVVEDDPGMLLVIEDLLIGENYSVDAVENGLKCCELLQSNDYDFVILDWDLPDINGIDILKKMRADGVTTPVMMLTGRTAVDYKAEGLDSGANDYLTKPFHFKEFLARVRAGLRQSLKANQPSMPVPLRGNNQELINRSGLAGTALVARYEFIELLGEGGVGIVFKARHSHLDKLVAIKMLNKEELTEEVCRRFEREARVISRLEHPNVARVFDFGFTEHQQPYMVMEYIEGKALDTILKEQKFLPAEQAMDIVMQACDGMSHAHSAGIVHRDIKPGNLVLREAEPGTVIVKILDFGCARLKDPALKKGPDLTQKGEVLGSPLYLCPEQIMGNKADERSDIYSLGCVFYQMLTGYPPHLAEDPMAIVVKHVKEDVLPFKKLRPDVSFPAGLEEIVLKMLEKEPQVRYQSMADVNADLARIRALSRHRGGEKWLKKFGNIIGRQHPPAGE